jgi:hypothetical protein
LHLGLAFPRRFALLELRVLRMALVQQDGAPEDLRDLHAGLATQPLRNLEARRRALGTQLELDELVVEQGTCDLGHDGLGDPLLADVDDRVQGVTGATQGASQGGGWHQRLLAGTGGTWHPDKMPQVRPG